MALSSNESDTRKQLGEKGISQPRLTSGMNRLGAKPLSPSKDKDKKQPKEKDRATKDADLIDTAKKRFSNARSIESTNRKEGVEDLEFLNSKQWSAADASSRAQEGRPCITENRLLTFANQITNDQRQNRPAINISPMGDQSSKKSAKVAMGMIRAIERDSNADIAYDTGFQSAVHNGWGFWRVTSEYESEDSFNQILKVVGLPNPMNVYMDPNRTMFELDAQWAFVTEMVPREDFKREYPDAWLTPWDEQSSGDTDKDWANDKEVRVAEYYYFTHEEKELIQLSNGHTGYEDDLDESIKAQIDSGKLEITLQRTVQCKKLKWAKMTSVDVLDEKDCDGQYIPIIECIGTILNINGKWTKKGIVRDAKGPQKMLNYYSTLETENVALQPKAPWIAEEGQLEGHEDKWQNANRKSYSYLLYKGTNVNGQLAPPPQRQPFQGPPAAILAAKQGAQEALKAVTGIRFDATMDERMQNESGRALRELSRNSNLGAYHFIDNFGRALKNTGKVLMDLIPYKYDANRVVAILDESGSDDRVMINPNMVTAHGEALGKTPDSTMPTKVQMFNPKIGDYQVTVTIGPSYATKRIEAAESQIDFLKAVPQLAPVLADLVAKNSDWQGAEEFANRIARTLPPNLLAPTNQDMSPQIQAMIQGLQKEIMESKQIQLQMMKDLSDRQKDRDVILHQVDSKHQADLVKIATTYEAKMEDIAAKRDANLQGTIGRQLAEVAKAVQVFNQMALPNSAQPAAMPVTPTQQPLQAEVPQPGPSL